MTVRLPSKPGSGLIEPRPGPLALSRRKRWHKIGYALTLVWLGAFIVLSEGKRSHPLSGYIFIVPLSAWMAAMVVDSILTRRRKPISRGSGNSGDRA